MNPNASAAFQASLFSEKQVLEPAFDQSGRRMPQVLLTIFACLVSLVSGSLVVGSPFSSDVETLSASIDDTTQVIPAVGPEADSSEAVSPPFAWPVRDGQQCWAFTVLMPQQPLEAEPEEQLRHLRYLELSASRLVVWWFGDNDSHQGSKLSFSIDDFPNATLYSLRCRLQI